MKSIYTRSGILLGLAITVAVFCFILPSAKVSNETGVVLNLPAEIPGLKSELIEMSAKEREWLPDTTRYIKRTYYPEGAQPSGFHSVNVSLIVSGGDERSLHRPSVCMDGQGWSIPSKTVRTLEVDGKQVEIMDLYLKRVSNGQMIEAHYYFFWVGRGISTPSYAKMKGISLWDNFSKNVNHRWAYPGVFLYVNPDAEDPQGNAWARAQHVLKHTIPHFHKGFGAEEEG